MKKTYSRITMGFLSLVTLGAILLYFFGYNEASTKKSWLSALFTATSGVCVTGLSVLDISSDFNFAGQLILLTLIQIGGLGILTVSTWLTLSLGKKLRIIQYDYASEIFGNLPYLSSSSYMKQIVVFTALAELTGAFFLFFVFYPENSLGRSVWLGIFHSISAFCNAGFSLFPTSMEQYKNHVGANLILMILIVSGGIGFLVTMDLLQKLKLGKQPKRHRLLLQSRISLLTSGFLILTGWLLIMVFEHQNALKNTDFSRATLHALFLSITSRTAGFNSVPTGNLSSATLLVVIMLMIVGASAGSTGGGIKTSTAAVLLAHARSVFKKRDNTEIFSRTISPLDVSKAAIIALGYLCVLITSLILMEYFERNVEAEGAAGKYFIDHFFEVVSALSTVGLSTGITQELTDGSKVILMVCMFTGRVGLLVLISSFLGGPRKVSYRYPVENVMIG